uniref:Tail protein n=1 Tax=viral metagenome TaxID=1070528 RepID=A0A6M3KS42_9ZZZZ
MDNLDQYLFPKNSPYTQNQGATSSFVFDYGNEAGVISTSKIRQAAIGNAQIGTAAIGTANIGTLSFNEITGGTATLGGTVNGNGLMNVLTAAGGTAVVLNNEGITVNNGSISIKNSGGTVAMDSSGIVSLANFKTSGYFDNTNYTTGSTSYLDYPNAILTSLVLTRNTNVLLYMTGSGYNLNFGTDGSRARIQFYDSFIADGITDFGMAGIFLSPYASRQTVSLMRVVVLATGTHNFKLRYKVDGASGTADIGYVEFGYIVLGT